MMLPPTSVHTILLRGSSTFTAVCLSGRFANGHYYEQSIDLLPATKELGALWLADCAAAVSARVGVGTTGSYPSYNNLQFSNHNLRLALSSDYFSGFVKMHYQVVYPNNVALLFYFAGIRVAIVHDLHQILVDVVPDIFYIGGKVKIVVPPLVRSVSNHGIHQSCSLTLLSVRRDTFLGRIDLIDKPSIAAHASASAMAYDFRHFSRVKQKVFESYKNPRKGYT